MWLAMVLNVATTTVSLSSTNPLAEAQAHEMLGLHAGMSASEAVAILSKYGKVDKINAPGIGVTYIGGKYAVTLCENSNTVRDVDHYLGSNFSEFRKSVESAEAASGPGKYRMFSGDKRHPFDTVEIHWGSNPEEVYSVSFTSFGSFYRAAESLFKKCT